jgi:predicted ATPase
MRLLRVQPSPAAEVERALPASVHAVIAARLDALPAGAKALIRDAAIVGTTFWAGALEALGADSGHLDELVARDFIRPVAVSSVLGEREYTFSHALVREVAYDQVPRAGREEKHRRSTVWAEGRSSA